MTPGRCRRLAGNTTGSGPVRILLDNVTEPNETVDPREHATRRDIHRDPLLPLEKGKP
jgi:hypothetical protein